jgi:hypothetical protein
VLASLGEKTYVKVLIILDIFEECQGCQPLSLGAKVAALSPVRMPPG